MDSVGAKQILIKTFSCDGLVTDDQILEKVHNELTSRSKLQFGSFGGGAFLKGGEVGPASELKRGRPKGAKAQDTHGQIWLIAALRFRCCPRMEMLPFLYGTEPRKDTRRQAFEKFLQRHSASIDQECKSMTEALATSIVKAKVTEELAEYIVKFYDRSNSGG